MDGAMVDDAAALPPSSATSKMKFMCSHGGKILPRPTDNQMKYVGGETRIVAVHRDITYTEMMKMLSSLFEGDIVLKYQLASEDLESLVSVRSDEDLQYMFEEYHRQERGGISKLRAFLFPAKPIVIDSFSSPVDPCALEQRYIDAINGVIRINAAAKTTVISPKKTIFTISSACSSPKSVSSDHHVNMLPSSREKSNSNSIIQRHQIDLISQDNISIQSYQAAQGMNRMHKVHSSPNLCNLSNAIGGPYGVHVGNHPHHRLHPHGRSPSLPPPPNLQTYQSSGHKVVGVEKPVRVDMAGRNSFSGYSTSRYHRGGGQQYYDDNGF